MGGYANFGNKSQIRSSVSTKTFSSGEFDFDIINAVVILQTYRILLVWHWSKHQS